MNPPLPDDLEQIALDSVGPTFSNLADPPNSAESSNGRDDDDHLIGLTIDGRRIVARIGTWTLGTVFAAVQEGDDEARIAIKTARRPRGREIDARLPQDALQVQARLGNHPNVATLEGAGFIADFGLYFTAENRDDQPIDAYCDLGRLGVIERLKLFITVCEAVHFTHLHGLIHGDLNPRKIRVTSDGVPRLADFGIAKLIQDRLGGSINVALLGPDSAEPTFLECLSPEQVEEGAVATSSDVYALGVVLYRLLTGRRPHRLAPKTRSEALQAIVEQTVEPPSLAVFRRDAAAKPDQIAKARSCTPRRLGRTLAGDLDAIIATALAKSSAKRYSSAQQLADDLKRFLAGAAVHARGDDGLYHLLKFARRHARITAGITTVALVLVLALVATTTGLIRTRRGQDHAQAAADDARRSIDLLLSRASRDRMLGEPGLESLRDTLLEGAKRFYQGFLDQRRLDPADQAEIAAAHARLGEIASLLGQTDQALKHDQDAAALWETLTAQSPDDRRYQEGLATALDGVGQALFQSAGRLDEARVAFGRARDLYQSLLLDDSRSTLARTRLGGLLTALAGIEKRTGRLGEARTLLQNAIDLETRLAADDPSAVDPRLILASAHAAMGRIHASEPDERNQAAQEFQAAIDLLTPLLQTHPEFAIESEQLAVVLDDLGRIQHAAGLEEAAASTYDHARDVLERLYQAHPGVPAFQSRLGATHNALCELARRRGETAQAETHARKAVPLFEKLAADHPKDADYRLNLAVSRGNLGRSLNRAGDPAVALQSLQRAVDLLESAPNLAPPRQYDLARDLALCIPLIGAGKTTENPQTAAPTLRRLYGKRATALLKQTQRAGFLTTDMIQNDPDLNSLRNRDDFRALIKEIEDAPLKPHP